MRKSANVSSVSCSRPVCMPLILWKALNFKKKRAFKIKRFSSSVSVQKSWHAEAIKSTVLAVTVSCRKCFFPDVVIHQSKEAGNKGQLRMDTIRKELFFKGWKPPSHTLNGKHYNLSFPLLRFFCFCKAIKTDSRFQVRDCYLSWQIHSGQSIPLIIFNILIFLGWPLA